MLSQLHLDDYVVGIPFKSHSKNNHKRLFYCLVEIQSCSVISALTSRQLSRLMKTLKAAISLLLLSSISALATELPSDKSATVTTPAPNWTGFFAGLNAGGTWVNNNNLNSTTQLLIPNPDTVSFYKAMVLSSPRDLSNSLGFIGGGQIGYNWQVTVSGL